MAFTDSWIFWVLLSMLVCAFSSGMEMAFISANHLKVELDKKQGVWSAGIVSYLIGQPKLFLSAMLIGNNIGLVVFGIKLGDEVVAVIEGQLPWTAEMLGGGGILLVQTVISTIVILIFGEFIPKVIVSTSPNRWLNILAIPLIIWYVVLWPFAYFVTSIAHIFIGKKSSQADEKRVFGRVDLDDYLETVTGNQDPSNSLDHEIEIFQNALDFSKIKARDCMIPRNEIVAVSVDCAMEELHAKFVESRLSKILVYRNNIDDIIGYVHSFDLLKKAPTLAGIIRPISIIPEAMPAQEMLSMNIREKRHVFIVIDEFGGTAGMATLEDVIEEIVGEIEDEHDDVEVNNAHQPDGTWLFTGRDEIKFLNDTYQIQLPENEEDYDTMNGLILYYLEDFPDEGQKVVVGRYEIEIIEVSEQMVKKVKVSDL
jgi:CBS domain containing-hemolysin-like protein